MMGGRGSPQTFSQGGNPAPYVPQNQAGLDQLFKTTLAGFPTNPAATPAGFYYPYAQNAVGNYALPIGTPAQGGGPASVTIPMAQDAAFTAASMGMGGAQALQGAGLTTLNT